MRLFFLHPTKFLESPLYKGKEESRMLVGSSYNILLSAPSFYKGISKDLVGSRNFFKEFCYSKKVYCLRGVNGILTSAKYMVYDSQISVTKSLMSSTIFKRKCRGVHGFCIRMCTFC